MNNEEFIQMLRNNWDKNRDYHQAQQYNLHHTKLINDLIRELSDKED